MFVYSYHSIKKEKAYSAFQVMVIWILLIAVIGVQTITLLYYPIIQELPVAPIVRRKNEKYRMG